jgi:hypothetical protein
MEEDEETRERVLREFNASTLDDVGPIGSDQGAAVLQNMNQLQSDQNEFVKRLAPRVDVL